MVWGKGMFAFQFKQIVFISTVIILSGLLVLTGCQNDDQGTPVYVPVASPPIEVTIEQIYEEHIADKIACDDKYNGKGLLFNGVTVEEVRSLINSENDVFMYNAYFIADTAIFIPKHTVYLDNIRVGFVVDIVGEYSGLIWSGAGEPLLQISNCWINIVEGEIIEGWYRNPEQY